jgi:hypothetical protein
VGVENTAVQATILIESISSTPPGGKGFYKMKNTSRRFYLRNLACKTIVNYHYFGSFSLTLTKKVTVYHPEKTFTFFEHIVCLRS